MAIYHAVTQYLRDRSLRTIIVVVAIVAAGLTVATVARADYPTSEGYAATEASQMTRQECANHTVRLDFSPFRTCVSPGVSRPCRIVNNYMRLCHVSFWVRHEDERSGNPHRWEWWHNNFGFRTYTTGHRYVRVVYFPKWQWQYTNCGPGDCPTRAARDRP